MLLEASVDSGNGGSWFGIDPRVLVSTNDGSFSVRGRTDHYPFRLSAALSPSMRARLTAKAPDWPVAPLAVLHWGSTKLPATFGDIQLDALQPIDIQVREPDGTPPGCIRVLLTRVGIGRNAPHDPVVAYTDRRGRIRVLAAERDDVLVHATTARGAAWQLLSGQDRRTTLEIDPRHVIPLRVVRANGEPLAGGAVRIVAPEAIGQTEVEVCRTMHDMCVVHAFSRKSCRLDQDGRGTIITPLLGVSLDLTVNGSGVAQRLRLPWTGEETEAAVLVVK